MVITSPSLDKFQFMSQVALTVSVQTKMEKVGLGLLYEQFVKLKNDLEKTRLF